MSKKEKAEKPSEKESKETRETKEKLKEEAKPAEAAPPEAAEEAKEVKKAAKGKIKRKKRIGKKIYTFYKIEGETVSRVRPFCERCGPGYFMADHGNRFSCGHCGFTRYKVAEPT